MNIYVNRSKSEHEHEHEHLCDRTKGRHKRKRPSSHGAHYNMTSNWNAWLQPKSRVNNPCREHWRGCKTMVCREYGAISTSHDNAGVRKSCQLFPAASLWFMPLHHRALDYHIA